MAWKISRSALYLKKNWRFVQLTYFPTGLISGLSFSGNRSPALVLFRGAFWTDDDKHGSSFDDVEEGPAATEVVDFGQWHNRPLILHHISFFLKNKDLDILNSTIESKVKYIVNMK